MIRRIRLSLLECDVRREVVDKILQFFKEDLHVVAILGLEEGIIATPFSPFVTPANNVHAEDHQRTSIAAPRRTVLRQTKVQTQHSSNLRKVGWQPEHRRVVPKNAETASHASRRGLPCRLMQIISHPTLNEFACEMLTYKACREDCDIGTTLSD